MGAGHQRFLVQSEHIAKAMAAISDNEFNDCNDR